MKTALIIAYVLIAVLAIVIGMQHLAIKKLTPVAPAAPAAPVAPGTAGADAGKKTAGDGSVAFGDMINAVKDKVKDLKIEAQF